jgi:hypothetical protein
VLHACIAAALTSGVDVLDQTQWSPNPHNISGIQYQQQ